MHGKSHSLYYFSWFSGNPVDYADRFFFFVDGVKYLGTTRATLFELNMSSDCMGGMPLVFYFRSLGRKDLCNLCIHAPPSPVLIAGTVQMRDWTAITHTWPAHHIGFSLIDYEH